ncbi:MAG: hypothetical protein FXF54_02840 [Kosmotoga sp.]|nr:MAG: hypothetical protein FXF54_02840 [Kosmotoga sp.]
MGLKAKRQLSPDEVFEIEKRFDGKKWTVINRSSAGALITKKSILPRKWIFRSLKKEEKFLVAFFGENKNNGITIKEFTDQERAEDELIAVLVEKSLDDEDGEFFSQLSDSKERFHSFSEVKYSKIVESNNDMLDCFKKLFETEKKLNEIGKEIGTEPVKIDSYVIQAFKHFYIPYRDIPETIKKRLSQIKLAGVEIDNFLRKHFERILKDNPVSSVKNSVNAVVQSLDKFLDYLKKTYPSMVIQPEPFRMAIAKFLKDELPENARVIDVIDEALNRNKLSNRALTIIHPVVFKEFLRELDMLLKETLKDNVWIVKKKKKVLMPKRNAGELYNYTAVLAKPQIDIENNAVIVNEKNEIKILSEGIRIQKILKGELIPYNNISMEEELVELSSIAFTPSSNKTPSGFRWKIHKEEEDNGQRRGKNFKVPVYELLHVEIFNKEELLLEALIEKADQDSRSRIHKLVGVMNKWMSIKDKIDGMLGNKTMKVETGKPALTGGPSAEDLYERVSPMINEVIKEKETSKSKEKKETKDEPVTKKKRQSDEDRIMEHFYGVIDNLSTEERNAVYEILSLEPGELHSLDNISIDKLQLMSLAAKLSFEQKPLIEIVNKEGYQIVWGRKFPEALHNRIKSELNG